ncbi:MAG: nicotinate-nucleotide--dimethylbenzimidazole phosphoribosyltransferase [Thermaurantimonas sp.]
MTGRNQFNLKLPDKRIVSALEDKLDRIQGRSSRYGLLEKLALRIGLIQQSLNPILQNPILLLFAGDHQTGLKILNDPVSPAARRIHKIFMDDAPMLKLARRVGVDIKIVDCGVHYPLEGFIDYWIHSGSLILNRKIRGSARDFIHEASITTQEVHQAIALGADMINNLYYSGTNVFLVGHLGSSCRVSTLALAASILDIDPSEIQPTIESEDELILKYAQLALKKHPKTRDVINQIAIWGNYQIAMMVGAMLKLAEKELLFLVDDNESVLALYTAWKLHPEVIEFAMVAQNTSKISRSICDCLKIEVISDFGITADEGFGALTCFQLLQSACDILI